MEDSYLTAMVMFDERTERRIQALKAAACAEQQACDILPPHLTLGVYVGLSLPALQGWAAEFAARRQPVTVTFERVEILGSRVCYLYPAQSPALEGLHQDFHQRYDDHAGEVGRPYSLAAGRWVPHCTLLIEEDPRRGERAAQNAAAAFVPFSGTVNGSAIGGDGPIRQYGPFTFQ